MLYVFLGVLAGQTCIPTTKEIKHAFRSTRCVFLGYSPNHKGVKCLDPSTGRVYISRDVVFAESVFPFVSLNSNAGKHL
jgi:histone deacetylase 1/2